MVLQTGNIASIGMSVRFHDVAAGFGMHLVAGQFRGWLVVGWLCFHRKVGRGRHNYQIVS